MDRLRQLVGQLAGSANFFVKQGILGIRLCGRDVAKIIRGTKGNVIHGERVSKYRLLPACAPADICRRVLDSLFLGNSALRSIDYRSGPRTCGAALRLDRLVGSSTSGGSNRGTLGWRSRPPLSCAQTRLRSWYSRCACNKTGRSGSASFQKARTNS